jgi:hypothetical protein
MAAHGQRPAVLTTVKGAFIPIGGSPAGFPFKARWGRRAMGPV